VEPVGKALRDLAEPAVSDSDRSVDLIDGAGGIAPAMTVGIDLPRSSASRAPISASNVGLA